MKHVLRKLMTAVMAIAIVATAAVALPKETVSAASGVTIYFQNSKSWSDVYCYTFSGSSSTGDVWPGTKMTSVGDKWYKITYTGTKPLNCIFSNGDKTQTSNHDPKDLDISKSAYWFTLSDSSGGSTGYGDGLGVTVNTSAQSGWPADSEDTTSASSDSVSGNSSSAENETSPKTGDNSTAAAAGMAVITVIAGAGLAFSIKKYKAK